MPMQAVLRHKALTEFLSYALPEVFEALGHSSEDAQSLTKSFILKIHHHAANQLAKARNPEISTQTSQMTSPDDIILLLEQYFDSSQIDLELTQATYLAIDSAIHRISIQVDRDCWQKVTSILEQKVARLKLV